MLLQLTCAVVDSDNTNREELVAFLSQVGALPVAQTGAIEALAGILAKPDAPALAIINLDPNPKEMLRKIGGLPRQFPNVSFFLMSHTVDSELLMESMHLGIREFIPLPISEQKFSAAIERVAQSHGVGKKAQMIHVIPTIGGCGSTTIACNLAASLATYGKTVLIDLDLMRGGVASYFDARARYTIADIMDAGEKLDKQLLDNALVIHKASGVSILARPELPEDSQRVNQAGLMRLLNVLGRIFDFVVVDSLMSISPLYAGIVAAAQTNVLVMQLNVPSAKNAERFMGVMRRMGVESSNVKLVVNRYVKKGSDIEPQDLERSLGLKVSWLVPNDYKNAMAAINFGEPVVIRAPKSEMGISLVKLAETMTGKVAVGAAA